MMPLPDCPDPDLNKARAEAIRKSPDIVGAEAYEAHRALLPLFYDGTPRPVWADLAGFVQWSWNRPGCP